MKHEEHYIQCAAVTLFRLTWRDKIICAIPNAGIRSPRQGKWMKDEGLLAGMPDLMIPEPSGPYHGVYVETKKPFTQPTISQFEMLNNLKRRGYYTFWFDNVDDFMENIKRYFNQGGKK